MNNHPFHLVDYSPWPLTGSTGAMMFVSKLVMMFHKFDLTLLYLSLLLLLLTMFQWWRNISQEGTFQGLHTLMVILGLKVGMILFIVSEMLFFFLFFWGFFMED